MNNKHVLVIYYNLGDESKPKWVVKGIAGYINIDFLGSFGRDEKYARSYAQGYADDHGLEVVKGDPDSTQVIEKLYELFYAD